MDRLTLRKQLKEFMHGRITQVELANQMGITQSVLSEMINGKRNAERLVKYLNEFYGTSFEIPDEDKDTPGEQNETKEYSSDFLASNATPSDDVVEIEYAGENRNHGIFFRNKKTGQLYISVPHVPYAARAEFPNLSDSLEPLSEWRREVYTVDRKANGTYLSFDVRGDSMDNGTHRSLQDGDKILARELELDNWKTLRAGDHRFWVIVFESSVLIKEISTFDQQTGNITCHSLNRSPEYHDFNLCLDDVRHLYYVIRIKPKEIILE